MTLAHVYSRVKAVVEERDALEFKLQAAQEYIEQLKRQKHLALLTGLILGTLTGMFWREIWGKLIQ